jgi:hypothetical protein
MREKKSLLEALLLGCWFINLVFEGLSGRTLFLISVVTSLPKATLLL